jgi:hypothetical protein
VASRPLIFLWKNPQISLRITQSSAETLDTVNSKRGIPYGDNSAERRATPAGYQVDFCGTTGK